LRHIVKLAAALCAAASIVHAAPISYLASDNINSTPVSAANPLPVSGTISSSAAPFAPTSATSNTSLGVGTTSSNVALPPGSSLLVSDASSIPLYFVLGTSNAVTATTSGMYLGAFDSVNLAAGTNTYLAAITASGSATLQIAAGSGAPSLTSTNSGNSPGAGPFNVIEPVQITDQSGLAMTTTFGSTLPASGTALGASYLGNLTAVKADVSGYLGVDCFVGCSLASGATFASGGAVAPTNGVLQGQIYLSSPPTWSTTGDAYPSRAADTHGDEGMCPVNAAGNCIDLSVPSTATSTQAATTLGSAGTFSSVLASNTSRKGCLVENTSAENEWVYFGATGSATTSNSLKVAAGYAVNCSSGPIVASDNIAVAGSVSSGDTVVVVSQ
jgi:hypothetical protein